MRFYFETSVEFFAWIAGPLHLAGIGTKQYSPLTELPVFILATEIIHTSFSKC